MKINSDWMSTWLSSSIVMELVSSWGPYPLQSNLSLKPIQCSCFKYTMTRQQTENETLWILYSIVKGQHLHITMTKSWKFHMFLSRYVTRWVKTRHIPHFTKIMIRLEIYISMCNYAAVKIDGSDRLLGPWVAERRASRTRNATFRENAMFLRCYVSPYTIVLRKCVPWCP